MALPFPADTFDAATMALVISFVPEPIKGVAEMTRVVRPGWPPTYGTCWAVDIRGNRSASK
jgi:ubiquinone/menaquinone biosynthesis C-methylase UbiE